MNVLPEDYMPDNFMPRYSEDEGHVIIMDYCY